MRCKEFDAHIDEMLSGVLQPEASEHMRQCERCTSYFRARAAVQNGLRALADAPASPSRATDRAVMDSYHRLQERRAAAVAQPNAVPRPAARLFSFPSRGAAARGSSHNNWTGMAVAAMLLAVIGSGIRLWNGVSTVSAPNVAPARVVASASLAAPADHIAAVSPAPKTTLTSSMRHASLRPRRLSSHPPQLPAEGAQLLEAKAAVASPGSATAPENSQQSIMHLAAVGASGETQTAGATWRGYSNLIACDPVVCSGPMQVIHIQVPAEQVQAGATKHQGKGHSYVNADVVVGPDGVARAIRVAN